MPVSRVRRPRPRRRAAADCRGLARRCPLPPRGRERAADELRRRSGGAGRRDRDAHGPPDVPQEQRARRLRRSRPVRGRRARRPGQRRERRRGHALAHGHDGLRGGVGDPGRLRVHGRASVAGGMVCWGAPDDTLAPPADPGSWDHTNPANYIDCVAYGSFSGPTNGFIGTPTPLNAEGHSLQRVSETHDNATDFACGDPADPENNAGTAASLAATVPCPVPPAVQTKAQQRCLVGLAKASAGLGGAQADEIRFCADAFTKGAHRVRRRRHMRGVRRARGEGAGEARRGGDEALRSCRAARLRVRACLRDDGGRRERHEHPPRRALGADPDAALVSREADARTAKCQVEVAKRLAARYEGVLKAAASAEACARHGGHGRRARECGGSRARVRPEARARGPGRRGLDRGRLASSSPCPTRRRASRAAAPPRPTRSISASAWPTSACASRV